MFNKFLTFIIVCLPFLNIKAQELDARVTINHQQVQGTSTSVFETLKTTLEEFLNDRHWTDLQFKKNERIQCNFSITIKNTRLLKIISKVHSTCRLIALFMARTTRLRPLPSMNLTSTFTIEEYDQIEFRSDVIDNNLTALLAYYVYLIIGIDMDAMSPLGGTSYLQTAQTIVNNAQSLNYKGWKAFEDSKNRHAIITDMLDGGMEPFRNMQYAYYREGLDVMNENVERGRAGITKAMGLLKQANSNKSMSLLPQIFTEYKRDELLSIYKGHGNAKEKEEIVETLSRINASQNSYWRQMVQ